MTAEKLFEHQGAILLAQSDGCAVWQFRNKTSDGTMTTYEIFSGVMLAFNDFHMERYECDFVADRRMLAIDHCREGRITPRAKFVEAWHRGRESSRNFVRSLPSATAGRFDQKCNGFRLFDGKANNRCCYYYNKLRRIICLALCKCDEMRD